MKFTIYRHLITYKNQVLVYQYYIICFLYIAKTLNLEKVIIWDESYTFNSSQFLAT